MKYLNLLLLFVPLAIIAEFLGWSHTLTFFASALAVVPLAAILGKATEELAAHTGPRLGGLLNATLGNAAELIITVFAIREGLLELVKASITGSILGNILLILGLSIFLGGLRHGTQRFDRQQASISATMMTLSIIGLAIPAIFGHAIEVVNHAAVEYLSLGVAGVMILVYILSLIYSFTDQGRMTNDQPLSSSLVVGHSSDDRASHGAAEWSVRLASGLLVASTLLIAWLSEILVGAVEPVTHALGLTEFFLGVVLVPLVGNVAEHLVSVQTAWKDQMDLSLAISLGSSMQIALFVGPLLVFVSLAMGNPMDLVFNRFEVASLIGAVGIAALISLDGESNWLEGAQLLAVYVIIAIAFFFLPT